MRRIAKEPSPVTGPWMMSDLRAGKVGHPSNGMTVFSCFHCGGGSSLGYKLAGFNVLGGIEIDSDMMKLYRKNHGPDERFSFQMPIQDFPAMDSKLLPKELFNLDVLDGSPPCSSFSMAGAREDGWNEKKMFREGQTEQVLDDLFFHFIKVADKLRPKMIVAENVKGLVIGAARGYVKEIFAAYSKAGYDTQLFLMNASRMGVPQARERTFFISRRRDLSIPKLEYDFNEPMVTVADAFKGLNDDGTGDPLSDRARDLYRKTMPGVSFAKRNNGLWFNWIRLSGKRPSPTLPATCRLTHPTEERFITYAEARRLQSFPDDYDFLDQDGRYVCGMSVPPLMAQRVALGVARALTAKKTT